ncbi:DUF1254 domain-containing protein [Dokdonella sp.]|uniref:DUF1254 domain-containing protein n=1 Tax=Dokdonella sp. TaxID=2291710 RepID=UPI0035286106
MKMHVQSARTLLATTMAIALLSACGKSADQASDSAPTNAAPATAVTEPAAPAGAPTVEELQAIAEENFIYGLPIVMNYAVMYEFAVDKNSNQFKAPFNEIKNLTHVATPKDTAVVTPNSDTPYSILWLDLRAEPMVISVPEVEGNRYYAVQLIDGNTYNFGYIGTRATGNKAGSYLVVGPDWQGEKPAGIDQTFRSTTPFVFANFRTQLFDPDDMPNVEKVQAGYKAQPLSVFLGQPAPPATPTIEFLPASTPGIKDNYWQYLDAALAFVPESENNRESLAKLARMGIGPAKTFDWKDLPQEYQQAIVKGTKAGAAKVTEFVASGSHDLNGWQVGSWFGDQAHFNRDWLLRAASVQAGLFGNTAEEASYPITRVDGSGQTLDGSQHNYTLTFPAGQYPPVNAFWSVTMYDGKTQLLIENPINRYLINSPMLPDLKKNPDGSLTLYIQHASPGKDKESNWLPAPNGPIYMVMRLYWPKPATDKLSILPIGKGTWKPPGIEVAGPPSASN